MCAQKIRLQFVRLFIGTAILFVAFAFGFSQVREAGRSNFSSTTAAKYKDAFAKGQSFPAVDNCDVVEIRAEKRAKNRSAITSGVGSVFLDIRGGKNQYYILTAAHVVSNSTRIQFKCSEQTFDSTLKGIDENTDVAVLVPEKRFSGNPVFKFEGEIPATIIQEKRLSQYFAVHTLKKFKVPSRTSTFVRTDGRLRWSIPGRYTVLAERLKDEAANPLIGSSNPFVLESHGIQPGMSGSPLLAFNDSYISGMETQLAGVLVKTFVNNTQSVAVPVDVISAVLPKLIEGYNSQIDNSRKFNFSKMIVEVNGNVSELPKVTFATPTGSRALIAACSGPYSNSNPIGSAGTQDSGAEGGSGGTGDGGAEGGSGGTGDGGAEGGSGGTGDGGGDPKKVSSYFASSFSSIYRDYRNCRYPGLLDQKGRLYIAIRENGKIRAITSFDDVSDLIRTHEANFPALLEKDGLTSNDQSIYSHYCNDLSIFTPKQVPYFVSFTRRDFNPKDEDNSSEVQSSAPYGSKDFYAKPKVKCDGARGEISAAFTYRDLSASLKFSPYAMSGTLKFRGCEAKFKNYPKGVWGTYYADNNLQFQISISPDENFIRIDIFGASERCNTNQQYGPSAAIIATPKPRSHDVWLSKFQFSLPRTD